MKRCSFNGKECMPELDWRMNDFGARMYDPVVGRWCSVDSLAAKYASLSPYAFLADNPVNHYDPDGNVIVALNKDAELLIQQTISYYGGAEFKKINEI